MEIKAGDEVSLSATMPNRNMTAEDFLIQQTKMTLLGID